MSTHLATTLGGVDSLPNSREVEQHSTGTAFILWLACLFGVCGIHRFYLGKPVTGLLYLLTFGVFGIGQVVDLFYMRDMVAGANAKKQLGAAPLPRLLPAPAPAAAAPADRVRLTLRRAAAQSGNQLSLAQASLATGLPEKKVEAILDRMVVDGAADIGNDHQSGAVVYTFPCQAPFEP
jgi:TM2 domain-containing membrane protein YozV